jgi:hypothetical protein
VLHVPGADAWANGSVPEVAAKPPGATVPVDPTVNSQASAALLVSFAATLMLELLLILRGGLTPAPKIGVASAHNSHRIKDAAPE